jgi:hypothetical protein
MSGFKATVIARRSQMTNSLVTDFVLTGALFGCFFIIFLIVVLATSPVRAASSAMELARLDSNRILQKSPGGQISQLEPIGVCRDPLAAQAMSPATPQRSVLILAKSKDIPSMRKDRNGWEEVLRRSPVTKASLIVREIQHQREVVTGQLEGLYLLRGYNDELRVTGTLDETGSDGVYVTKAIDMELSSVESSFASFNGNQVFECRLTHPQLIRFEK